MIYHSCDSPFGRGGCFPRETQHKHCCCAFCCQPIHRPYPPQPPIYPPMPPTPGSLSILTAANGTATTVAAGGTLPFAFNSLSYGEDISHNPGTAAVTINTPGVYLLHFQGTATPLPTTPADTSVSSTVTLNLNGSPIPGGSATNTFADATVTDSLGISTAVAVSNVPATITVTLPEEGAVFTDSALTVYRLGAIPATIPPAYYPGGNIPVPYNAY